MQLKDISDPEERKKAVHGMMRLAKDFIEKVQKENPQYKGLIGNVPKKYRSLYCRTFIGDASPNRAIKSKCLECSGFQREEVTNCQVRTCPLWQYRPFQKC